MACKYIHNKTVKYRSVKMCKYAKSIDCTSHEDVNNWHIKGFYWNK